MDEVSDEDLMLRYAGGEVHAFEALYARHKGPLFRYLSRQLSDQGVVEEAFQDVWANLVRSRERYEVKARFTTWLYRMAHNRVIDAYRAQGRRQETSLTSTQDHTGNAGHADYSHAQGNDSPVLELADHRPGIERQLEASQAVEQLRVALKQLPQNQLEAFLLQEETGLSLEEIAKVTGVGRETVKSRLRYAVAKLRAAVSWSGAPGE